MTSSNAVVLVGAQRRITFAVKVPGSRKPVPFTFWPSSKEHPNRVNRCPVAIWQELRQKVGSPRQDQNPPQSPLDEYLETGLLWEMTPGQANLVNDGKAKNVSPQGPVGGAHRPQPREPQAVEGLKGVGQINQTVAEQTTIEVPA